ncbi:hypothetical protein PYW08_012114 [Mythimna loreyi]|uniref:Uncharacterized protein n=1 Tax=Mythimna loreyi TaxID=667449 RepID=A0ACC2Q4C2_9NEOP|nr:hypothetical protein PYW08_012114 [Mythimna loreyi]
MDDSVHRWSNADCVEARESHQEAYLAWKDAYESEASDLSSTIQAIKDTAKFYKKTLKKARRSVTVGGIDRRSVMKSRPYLAAEDVNLIMVDWSIGAGVDYIVALNNTIRSGEHVARFITWLNSASGAKLDRYHVIGHSLGAHQAGIIGRHLGGGLAYITALDPALPGWITNPSSFRPSDGVYTEVIHTDAGFSGLLSPVGDVDFYPNGGRNMPGCSTSNCSHHRCIFYMAESLISGGFTGTSCDILAGALTGNCTSSDTLKMGGLTAKPGSSGLYYLTTNAEFPFSQG